MTQELGRHPQLRRDLWAGKRTRGSFTIKTKSGNMSTAAALGVNAEDFFLSKCFEM